MYKVKVFVTLKESILDPTGIATKDGLNKLGYKEVREVRVGKVIYLDVDRTENIEELVKEMCEKLLVNQVMENYTYEIEGRYS